MSRVSQGPLALSFSQLCRHLGWVREASMFKVNTGVTKGSFSSSWFWEPLCSNKIPQVAGRNSPPPTHLSAGTWPLSTFSLPCSRGPSGCLGLRPRAEPASAPGFPPRQGRPVPEPPSAGSALPDVPGAKCRLWLGGGELARSRRLVDESTPACHIWPSVSQPVMRERLVSFGKAFAHQRPNFVPQVTTHCSKGLTRSLVTFSNKLQFSSEVTAQVCDFCAAVWMFRQGPWEPDSVRELFWFRVVFLLSANCQTQLAGSSRWLSGARKTVEASRRRRRQELPVCKFAVREDVPRAGSETASGRAPGGGRGEQVREGRFLFHLDMRVRLRVFKTLCGSEKPP